MNGKEGTNPTETIVKSPFRVKAGIRGAKRSERLSRTSPFWFLVIILALTACLRGEETVETDILIVKAEVFDAKGERVSSSDFAYNGRCLLVSETHHSGESALKVAFTYDEKDRLKTRVDDGPEGPPVRLDYTYSDDGGTVNVKQTSEGQPAQEMNNIYEHGVLVGRNWGERRPNGVVFKLETAVDTIVRKTYLAGGVLRSTETMTFNPDGLLSAVEFDSDRLVESRRYTYDGKKLIKETVTDKRGNVTSEIRFSYSPVNVLKAYAGTYNYLHVGNLVGEVRGGKAP
ncbi:MAG: hypothetical protein JXD23_10790 [Spirochaetales bacterium]|nr:hypothetical protein [Spirochaetales bacterium]